MYKVLIADDDMLVRIDMKSIIDWEKHGMELIEDAANGVEAMERVRKYNPDIIILDLGMPLMNGLEVIRRIKDEKFSSKIIVLSCHDDFDSVSEALKMGAIDYILKHTLKVKDLNVSINKAIEAIKKERTEHLQKEKMEAFTEISFQVLKENVVKDLVSGVFRDNVQLTEVLKELNIKDSFNRFVIILAEIDDLHSFKEKYSKTKLLHLLKSVNNVLYTTLKEVDCIHAYFTGGEYCIVIDFSKTNSFLNINIKTLEICESIIINMKKHLGLQLSIGLSGVCENISSAKEYYKQARLALDGKIYLGRNRIIHYSEVENYSGKLENSLSEYENDIIQAIMEDNNRIKNCVNFIFNILKSKYIKPEQIRLLCFELLILTSKMIKEYGLNYKDTYKTDCIPYDYVMNLETFNDIQEWFVSVCINLNRAINERMRMISVLNPRREIKRALEYIDKNFMIDISLQEIADHSNLSRTYFSQVFRQEMGESFSEYLIRFRIEKAKLLIKNSEQKVCEVGKACGFNNYRYFTKLFKDFTGVSPSKYKNA